MGKPYFAFSCAVNRVIHNGIASYAHFHDACFKYLKLFGWTHIIILIWIKERVNENVRVYFCPGSSEEMGHFRKTGAEAMRGKPHTRRGEIQPYVADTKGRRKTSR